METMRQYEQIVPSAVPRINSCKSNNKIIPATYVRSPSSSLNRAESLDDAVDFHHRPLVRRASAAFRRGTAVSAFLRSLLSIFTFPTILPTCRWLAIPTTHLPYGGGGPSLGRKVTGTLFGHRRGHVNFAVQDHPRSDPVLVIELAVSTSTLVKEMSSGLVRIALECEKTQRRRGGGRPAVAAEAALFGEPSWTMYCNGRKCGYAMTRKCTESDMHVLSTVRSVSVGAGVIPVVDDGGAAAEGELLYMRARFERVVGSRDSEAFYMLNPDGNGGPELSIFLLRI